MLSLFSPNKVMLLVRSSYQCFGEILPFPIPLHGHVTLLWFHHSLNIVKKDLIPKLSTHHLRHSSRFRLVLIQVPSQCDTRGAQHQSPNHRLEHNIGIAQSGALRGPQIHSGLKCNACHSYPKTAERLSTCSRNVRNFNDSGFWVCFRCYDMHNTLECTEIHKRMSLYIAIIYVERILQEDDSCGTLHWSV